MLLVAMAVSLLTAVGVSWAQEVSTSTLNPAPDDTWMTNGTVYSVIRHGDYIYVGGKFNKVRRQAVSRSG
jgi:hypothetical protein